MDSKSMWEEALYRDFIKHSYLSSHFIEPAPPPTFKQKMRNVLFGIYYRLSDTFLVLVGEKIAVNEDTYYDD